MFRFPIKWMMLIIVVAIATTCSGSSAFDDLESKLEAFKREENMQRAEDAERIRQLEAIVSSQDRSIGLAVQRTNDLENKMGQMQTISRRQINVYAYNMDQQSWFNSRVEHVVWAKAIYSTSRNSDNEVRVAFSAVLDHDLDGLPNSTAIVFNNKLYNSGSYDTNTGVFTAPLDGVYLFIYFIGNRHAREVDAGLLLNGVKQNEAVAEGVASTHDTQGGNSAVLELNAGDRVWLATTWGNHVEGQWKFSSFTGTLLFAN